MLAINICIYSYSNQYRERNNLFVSIHFTERNYPTGITKEIFLTAKVRETALWFLYSIQRENTLQELASTGENGYLKEWFLWVYSRETKEMFLTTIARKTTIGILYSILRKTTLQELASTRENKYIKVRCLWVYSRETKDLFLTNIGRETTLWFLYSILRETTIQELASTTLEKLKRYRNWPVLL